MPTAAPPPPKLRLPQTTEVRSSQWPAPAPVQHGLGAPAPVQTAFGSALAFAGSRRSGTPSPAMFVVSAPQTPPGFCEVNVRVVGVAPPADLVAGTQTSVTFFTSRYCEPMFVLLTTALRCANLVAPFTAFAW